MVGTKDIIMAQSASRCDETLLKLIHTGTLVDIIRRHDDIKSNIPSFDLKLSFIAEKTVPEMITAKLKEKEADILFMLLRRFDVIRSRIFCISRLFWRFVTVCEKLSAFTSVDKISKTARHTALL